MKDTDWQIAYEEGIREGKLRVVKFLYNRADMLVLLRTKTLPTEIGIALLDANDRKIFDTLIEAAEAIKAMLLKEDELMPWSLKDE